MGRQKIEIKKIIDKQRKHITFTKRRKGLFKMMADTASKYNVEIASVVFSECGRVYSFGSHQLDTTIDKFLRDSGSSVSTIHCQEVEKRGNSEGIRALIEEAKKYVSKNDSELMGVDELINYRSDLQILKDKLVGIWKNNCCSKESYNDGDSSSSRNTEYCVSNCKESVSKDMVVEPARLELVQTQSETDTIDTYQSYYKELENMCLPEEPAVHEMVQIPNKTDLSETFDAYSNQSVCEGILLRDVTDQTGKGGSLEKFYSEDASLSTNAGYSQTNFAAMSDSSEVSNSYWTDLVQECLSGEEILAPNSFASIGAMNDWGEVFGSSWTGLDLEHVYDEHYLVQNSCA